MIPELCLRGHQKLTIRETLTYKIVSCRVHEMCSGVRNSHGGKRDLEFRVGRKIRISDLDIRKYLH